MWVPICLYCSNCTKFGQMMLRKIIKIVATRCQILRLKCTKLDFGWGSPDPAGGADRAPPDPLARFEGVLLLREGRGMGEGKRRGRGRKGRKGEVREGRRGGRGKEGKREGCVMAFGGWTPLPVNQTSLKRLKLRT